MIDPKHKPDTIAGLPFDEFHHMANRVCDAAHQRLMDQAYSEEERNIATRAEKVLIKSVISYFIAAFIVQTIVVVGLVYWIIQ